MNKSKRKKIFISEESLVRLTKKKLDYFCFSFLKFSVGLIKDLQEFSNKSENQRIQLESVSSFYLFQRNTHYFYDLKNIHIQRKDKINAFLFTHYNYHKLAFYKFYI